MNDKTLTDIIEKGLRGNTINDLVEGWSFHIDEVSSNVYKIDAIDQQGHHVSSYGIDPEKVLSQCIEKAERITERTNLLSTMKSNISKIFRLKK